MQIKLTDCRELNQDAAGQWTMVWAEMGLNERVSQSDVIDMLKRDGQIAKIREINPMQNFTA